MSRYLPAFAAILLVMIALDVLWLGFIAKPLYQNGIGHLMAERPNLWAAGAFYLLYALGLTVFAVMPHADDSGWSGTASRAALFGLVAYATYDLSNLATLKSWPIGLALIDMAWGSALSAMSAVAGRAAHGWSASG